MKKFLTILTFSITLIGCMVGPRFRTPQIDMPAEFGSGALPSDSLAELCWWTIFPDSILHRLIMLALENNRSAEIALSRVETARLNLGIARSHLLPGVALNLSGQYGNLSASAIKPENPIQIYSTPMTISWEADIFGANRRTSEKARYELLASEYGLRAVRLSLIAEVAHSYFSLLEYKRSLAIAQSTLATRNTSYNLMLESFNQGTISELELRQAETQRAVVATAVPKYRLAIAETAHALSVLTGQWATDSLTTGLSLSLQSIPEEIPTGLPSQLLERRPDIMQQWALLGAANAGIGIAQAARFPTLTLTGQGGMFTRDISNILKGESFMWQAAGSIVQPILNFGANRKRVKITREQYRQQVLQYEQTVLQAYSEVKDALEQIESYKQQYIANAEIVAAARITTYLSQKRYISGFTDYLEVLDSERDLFDAELELSTAMSNWLNAYVSLYKALGGGWITPPPPKS